MPYAARRSLEAQHGDRTRCHSRILENLVFERPVEGVGNRSVLELLLQMFGVAGDPERSLIKKRQREGHCDGKNQGRLEQRERLALCLTLHGIRRSFDILAEGCKVPA